MSEESPVVKLVTEMHERLLNCQSCAERREKIEAIIREYYAQMQKVSLKNIVHTTKEN